MMGLLDEFLLRCRGVMLGWVAWFERQLNTTELTPWSSGLKFFILLGFLMVFCLFTMPLTWLFWLRRPLLEDHPLVVAERLAEERRFLVEFRIRMGQRSTEKVDWIKDGF